MILCPRHQVKKNGAVACRDTNDRVSTGRTGRKNKKEEDFDFPVC
jgi:hypothetical protein